MVNAVSTDEMQEPYSRKQGHLPQNNPWMIEKLKT